MRIEALSGRVVMGGVSLSPDEASRIERDLHIAIAKAASQEKHMRERWMIDRANVRCIECGEKADFLINGDINKGGCYSCANNAGDLDD